MRRDFSPAPELRVEMTTVAVGPAGQGGRGSRGNRQGSALAGAQEGRLRRPAHGARDPRVSVELLHMVLTQ